MNMTMMQEEMFYHTSDLALATVLSLSYPIEATDKSNPRKAQFIFRRDKNLDALIEDYWRGEVRVEPQVFFQQLRGMKARIYND